MKDKINVGMIIATFTLFLYYVLMNLETVSAFFDNVTNVMFPFIFGFALAFLLNPIMLFFEEKVYKNWNCKAKLKRLISMFIALFIAIVVVGCLVMMIVPAIIESVSDLLSHSEEYIASFTGYVVKLFETFNLDSSMVDTWITQFVGEGNAMLEKFGTFFSVLIPKLISTSYGVIRTLLNILFGICAAMYLLMD